MKLPETRVRLFLEILGGHAWNLIDDQRIKSEAARIEQGKIAQQYGYNHFSLCYESMHVFLVSKERHERAINLRKKMGDKAFQAMPKAPEIKVEEIVPFARSYSYTFGEGEDAEGWESADFQFHPCYIAEENTHRYFVSMISPHAWMDNVRSVIPQAQFPQVLLDCDDIIYNDIVIVQREYVEYVVAKARYDQARANLIEGIKAAHGAMQITGAMIQDAIIQGMLEINKAMRERLNKQNGEKL